MASPIPNEHVQNILDAFGNPSDSDNAQLIQGYLSATSPRFDSETQQVIPAKFQPIPSEHIVEAMTPPENNMDPENPGSPPPSAQGTLGGVIGVAEGMNPLPPAKMIIDYATGSKDKTPEDIDSLAALTRTAARGVFGSIVGDKTPIGDIYDEERASQSSAFSDPSFQSGKTAGEIGTALASAGSLGSDIYSAIKASPLAENLLKLKGLASVIDTADEVGNPAALDEAKALQKNLIGDLGSEQYKALYQDPDKIKALVKDPKSNSQDIVFQIRNQTQQTRDVLGQSVGAVRDAITQNHEAEFDTSFAQKALDQFQSKQTLSGGRSTLSSGDQKIISNLRMDLQNPDASGATNSFTTRDASVLIDKLDTTLKDGGYYKDLELGQKPSPTMQKLFDIRQGVDAELANMYPEYKAVKTNYSEFTDLYHPFQSRLNGMNAESFVGNMFGKAKGEQRDLFSKLLDKSNQVADDLKELSSKVSDGSVSLDPKYEAAVKGLSEKASQLQGKNGADVLNEIADRSVAAKIRNLSDPQQDTIRELQKQWATGRLNKFKAAGATAGGGLGYAVAGPTGAGVGSVAGGYLAGLLTEGGVNASASKMFTADQMFDLISQSKQPTKIKQLMSGMKMISSNLGPDVAIQYLNQIPLTPSLKGAMDAAKATLEGSSVINEGKK